MKKYKVRPAEPFALEFADKTIIEMSFNMKALSYLGELINEKKTALSGPTFYASIIYAGCKSMNSDFTEEEAQALYITLSEANPDAMTAIFNEYCDAANIDQTEIKKNILLMMK